MSLHLVEYSGDGGIYQHVVAIANCMSSSTEVIVHTAASCELAPTEGRVCACHNWHTAMRPRALRAVAVATSVLGLWHHVTGSVRPGDVVHFHGTQGLSVLPQAFSRTRSRKGIAVFSPHNVFSRRSRNAHPSALMRAVRAADVVVVYADSDVEIVRLWGQPNVIAVPLIQHVPVPSPVKVQEWRQRFGEGSVVLIPGQIRPDKGIDEVLQAVSLLERGDRPTRVVAVGRPVGEIVISLEELAKDLGVAFEAISDYLVLDDFVAAVAAAGCVVTAYPYASQSGVLRVAARLGVPSVATDVGGLGCEASVAVPLGNRRALATAIHSALVGPRPYPRDDTDAAVVGLALAYGNA